MIDAKRVLSRRALTLARNPAAWHAAFAQHAWRLRGPCPPAAAEPRVAGSPATIYWPTEYQHVHAAPFVQPLRSGFGTLASVEPRIIPQPYEGIVVFDIGDEAQTFSGNPPLENPDKPTLYGGNSE